MCDKMSFHFPLDKTALPGMLFEAGRNPSSTAFLRRAIYIYNHEVTQHKYYYYSMIRRHHLPKCRGLYKKKEGLFPSFNIKENISKTVLKSNDNFKT